MKKLVTVAIIFLVCISFLLSSALAENKPLTETKPASPAIGDKPSADAKPTSEMKSAAQEKRKTSMYTGIVEKVNSKKKTVEVIKEKMDLGMVFHINKETRFEGYKGLRNIKRGDRVKVEYDVIVAKSIALTVSKDK